MKGEREEDGQLQKVCDGEVLKQLRQQKWQSAIIGRCVHLTVLYGASHPSEQW